MSENNHIEDLIVRYFQEEINGDELCELETWLMASPENKTHFFQLKRISDLSRRNMWSDAKKEASWLHMHDRLKTDDKKVPSAGAGFTKSRRISLLKYAAVALVALSIGWGINEFTGYNKDSLLMEAAPVYNEIKVEKGGRGNTLVLSDGTKVTLNAATALRYPTNFSTADRTVYLDGEAYFDVAEDEEKPFIVKLKKQDVTVLGTSFNVEAYSDESYSVITLFNGSVSLESYNAEGESMSQMFLKPNQRAVSDNQTGSVSLENIEISLADAWTEGKYKFKDESLFSIAKRLEKYYGVQVHIENESLKKMKFTGTFSLDQDIQEVLRVMDHEKRYKVKQIEKDIYINK